MKWLTNIALVLLLMAGFTLVYLLFNPFGKEGDADAITGLAGQVEKDCKSWDTSVAGYRDEDGSYHVVAIDDLHAGEALLDKIQTWLDAQGPAGSAGEARDEARAELLALVEEANTEQRPMIERAKRLSTIKGDAVDDFIRAFYWWRKGFADRWYDISKQVEGMAIMSPLDVRRVDPLPPSPRSLDDLKVARSKIVVECQEIVAGGEQFASAYSDIQEVTRGADQQEVTDKDAEKIGNALEEMRRVHGQKENAGRLFHGNIDDLFSKEAELLAKALNESAGLTNYGVDAMRSELFYWETWFGPGCSRAHVGDELLRCLVTESGLIETELAGRQQRTDAASS